MQKKRVGDREEPWETRSEGSRSLEGGLPGPTTCREQFVRKDRNQ